MKIKTFLALLLLVIVGCGCQKNSELPKVDNNLLIKEGFLTFSPTASTECGGRTHLLLSKEEINIVFQENIAFSKYENKEVIVKGILIPQFKDCPRVLRVKEITLK